MPDTTPTVNHEPIFKSYDDFDIAAAMSARLQRRDSNEAKVLTLLLRAAEEAFGPGSAHDLYSEALELSLQERGYRSAICAARSSFDNHVPNMLAHRPVRRASE